MKITSEMGKYNQYLNTIITVRQTDYGFFHMTNDEKVSKTMLL